MNEDRSYIGRRIREARDIRGKTQAELGDALGYTPMAISHFEKGIRELKFSDLQKVAEFFAMPLNFFLPSSSLAETTLFRTSSTDDPEISKALNDFDKFIRERK